MRFAVSAPPLDGDGDVKAARVPGRFGLFFQRFLYHGPGDVVDGSFAHGLVETGLCHPAHALTAVDAHLAGQLGPEGDTGDDRQTGGHVHIVAAVLPDGALSPLAGQAAEDRLYLHHDALGVRRATVSGVRPVSSNRAAPAAPSAAQVPVV